MFDSIEAVITGLAGQRYVADRSLATAVLLAARLEKPLLLEGEAGVGKTEVGRALAGAAGAELVRLQGYEGIDVSQAVYDWNYARQIMTLRTTETVRAGEPVDVFSADYLIKRPLLKALESAAHHPTLLLIDELDRADDEFEAFLLELLSDFQITIPEIGTVRAETPPLIVITSNRTRELHEALKRRCLYHWIDYPDFRREMEVVGLKAPEATDSLRRQAVHLAQDLRRLDLYKAPGMSETIDFARGLAALGEEEITEPAARDTLGLLLKNQEDIQAVVEEHLPGLVRSARQES